MRKKLKVFITIIAIIGALICAFILTYIKENNLNAHQVYVRYMSSDQHHVRDICFDLTKNDEYNSVDDVKNKIIGKSSEEE